MNTSLAVTLAAVLMGGLLFGAIYIGLHFGKKSAEKFRKENGIDTDK